MIEYRTERLDPQSEDNVTNILGTFGWTPVSSQEVYNESTEVVGVDVKTYGDGLVGSFMQGFTGKDGSINVRQRTNVTNYVVVKYARDTDMPNYERLSQLNAEFESKLSVDEPRKPIKRTALTVIGILIIVISIVLAIVQHNSAEIWEICVCVIFPIVTIPITVLGWRSYKRKLENYNLVQNRLNEIYEEALSLAE